MDLLPEQFGVLGQPVLELADQRQITERPLRNIVIIEPVVVSEHRVQVRDGVKLRRTQNFGNLAIEALHRAVGLGMAALKNQVQLFSRIEPAPVPRPLRGSGSPALSAVAG